MDDALTRTIAARLARAERALFVTGAGLSADSGLPTYRGVGGLYDVDETEEGFPIEVALSDEMMRRAPHICWRYIHQIEAACRGASPNRGHEVIAALESRLSQVTVLTQNVDGLHQAAGSTDVIAIHGDVHRLRCVACGRREGVADYSGLDGVPACPGCGGLVRPEVVLFGEALPPDEVRRLEGALNQGFDVVFSIGTTSVFPYIAAPVALARRWGALSVEINPGRSEVSHLVDHRLRVGAADALGAIFDAMP